MDIQKITLRSFPEEAYTMLELPVRMRESTFSSDEQELALYQVWNGEEWTDLLVKVLPN